MSSSRHPDAKARRLAVSLENTAERGMGTGHSAAAGHIDAHITVWLQGVLILA